MFQRDHESDTERERTPAHLSAIRSVGFRGPNLGGLTAVTVSIQRTNGSDVMYRESENAYSFHNCPKTSCLPGMLL